jgi:potassium-transporting ATPase KdpC subunit
MMRQFVTAVLLIAALTAITGIVYPLAVTGVSRLVFPERAEGSFIRKNGTVIGSAMIGQPFSRPEYFWGRPSATAPFPYNAAASSGSNYGPLHPALHEAVRRRVTDLKTADPENKRPIPVDLVTASGSGLDPDISIAAAEYQLPRVARARHIPEEDLRVLVKTCTAGRGLWFLGEPRVNVLTLNLALDELHPVATE